MNGTQDRLRGSEDTVSENQAHAKDCEQLQQGMCEPALLQELAERAGGGLQLVGQVSLHLDQMSGFRIALGDVALIVVSLHVVNRQLICCE